MTLKSERQDIIVKEVLQRGSVTVGELAKLFDVSEITIRRDLDELAKSGAVNRVRGGARRLSPKGPEPPVVQREKAQLVEKKAIGRAALSLIDDGDAVAILSGSTPIELVRFIAQRTWENLLVITNGIMLVQELIHTPGVQVVLIGGVVNRDEMGTFGVLAVDMVKRIRLHKLFTGCRGINPDLGTSNDLNAEAEVALVRALAMNSEQVIVIADHTKLGNDFLLTTLRIEEIDVFVTDSRAPSATLERISEQDVKVIIAQLEPLEPINQVFGIRDS
ncbi:MAG: DeoR family transcriptional regulator [Anaerolineales bacterium]|nr:DeoR family transcriptional regulator [Anaerolineales bacterium]